MKKYNGRAIYQPSGKAAEYAAWAVNFYNGCSAMCHYCYNRKGITSKVLGGDIPIIKKSLMNDTLALQIFIREVDSNIDELRKHGLFFNFVSDPFLRETYVLNLEAIRYCLANGIPVKTLTKQTWWLEHFLRQFDEWIDENLHRHDWKHLIAFGFTLTGHDEMEPGAATNEDRIRAIGVLSAEGFKTWASIEPIIDIQSSLTMIEEIRNDIDLIKIGLQSGEKYDKDELTAMIAGIFVLADMYDFKIYLKDSLVKALDIPREKLPQGYCVTNNYNMF